MNAGRLVLSHNMERSLSRLDEARVEIAKFFSGPVNVAYDGVCYVF